MREAELRPGSPAIRYGTALDGSDPPHDGETLASLRAAVVSDPTGDGGEAAARRVEQRAAEVVQEWAAWDIAAQALGPEAFCRAMLESAERLVEQGQN